MEQYTAFVASRGILKSCQCRNTQPASGVPDIDADLLLAHQPGGAIYVCTDAVANFAANFSERVDGDFVLVSGDSDLPVDHALLGDPNVVRMLEGGRLRAWYAQNLIARHPLIHPLPIGMDYHTMWEKPGVWGLTAISPLAQESALLMTLAASPEPGQRYLGAYCNWHFALERGDRAQCSEQMDRTLCFFEPCPVTRHSTWMRQAEFLFVISPEGGGLDCHRTWEALLLGCVPVIRRNALAPLFDRLPVLIVDDWSQVRRERLTEYASTLHSALFDFNTLFRDYWMCRIANRRPEKLPDMTIADFRRLLVRKTG